MQGVEVGVDMGLEVGLEVSLEVNADGCCYWLAAAADDSKTMWAVTRGCRC